VEPLALRNTSIKSRSARVSKPKVSRDRSLSCRATRLNWERVISGHCRVNLGCLLYLPIGSGHREVWRIRPKPTNWAPFRLVSHPDCSQTIGLNRGRGRPFLVRRPFGFPASEEPPLLPLGV
jgi:hypothetical protein